MTQEELQLEWDRWLVTCFYEQDKGSVIRLANEFRARFDLPGIYEPPMIDLLRYPKMNHHFKNSLGRFVCAYLPTIGEALWKYDKSRIEEIVKAVNKLKSTTRQHPIDRHKTEAEGRARKQAREASNRAKLEREGTNEVYGAYRRRNQWGVTK